MLTRRFILAAAAATAAAGIVPASATVISPDAEAPTRWFMVATEDHCQLIRAASKQDATSQWLVQQAGAATCQEAGADPEECDCYVCDTRRSLMGAYHEPALDGRECVGPRDYFDRDIALPCPRCNEYAWRQDDARMIGDDAICEGCLTPAEREIVSHG